MSINWQSLFKQLDELDLLGHSLANDDGSFHRAQGIIIAAQNIRVAMNIIKRDHDSQLVIPCVPDVARARNTDPETSRAAARSLDQERLTAAQDQLLVVFAARTCSCDDSGLTDETLARIVMDSCDGIRWYRPMAPSSIRTRRKELERKGLIEAVFDEITKLYVTMRLASGRFGMVYRITEAGEEKSRKQWSEKHREDR